MKRVIVLFLFGILLTTSCEESPVTGSDDVVVIESMQIRVDSTWVFGDEFRASGIITNTGRSSVTPMWYLEMSVFSDSRRNFKFGGSNTSFNYSLDRNQSTGWEIRFSSSQYKASEYPNFSVGELRAFKYSESE